MGGFYTTAVVNIMSWNMAYSMFPDVTFLEPRKTFRLSWQPHVYADHRKVRKAWLASF